MNTMMKTFALFLLLSLFLCSCSKDKGADFPGDNSSLDDIVTKFGIDMTNITTFDSVTVYLNIAKQDRARLIYHQSDMDANHRIHFDIVADESSPVEEFAAVWSGGWVIATTSSNFLAGENAAPRYPSVITPVFPSSVTVLNGTNGLPSIVTLNYQSIDIGGTDSLTKVQTYGYYSTWYDSLSSAFSTDIGGDGVDFTKLPFPYFHLSDSWVPSRGILKSDTVILAKTLNLTVPVTIQSVITTPVGTSAFDSAMNRMVIAANSRSYSLNPIVKPLVGDSGYWIDSRDQQSYPFVRIGFQIWMQKDMRYLPPQPYNAAKDPATSIVYYDSTSATVACPAGWRLPSGADFARLETLADTLDNMTLDSSWNKSLRSTSGWSTPGTDLFSFSAQPMGYSQDSVVGLWTVYCQYVIATRTTATNECMQPDSIVTKLQFRTNKTTSYFWSSTYIDYYSSYLWTVGAPLATYTNIGKYPVRCIYNQ